MAEWITGKEFDRPSTAQVEKLISVMGDNFIGAQDIMNLCGIVRRKTIQDSYLTPALSDGSIEQKFPDQPKRLDQITALRNLQRNGKKNFID